MTGAAAAANGHVLLADIGGTNARFALADTSSKAPLIVDSVEGFSGADFPSLADAAKHYLDHTGATAQNGVFAVAGRVDGGAAERRAANAGYRAPAGKPDKRARRLIRALGDLDAL